MPLIGFDKLDEQEQEIVQPTFESKLIGLEEIDDISKGATIQRDPSDLRGPMRVKAEQTRREFLDPTGELESLQDVLDVIVDDTVPVVSTVMSNDDITAYERRIAEGSIQPSIVDSAMLKIAHGANVVSDFLTGVGGPAGAAVGGGLVAGTVGTIKGVNKLRNSKLAKAATDGMRKFDEMVTDVLPYSMQPISRQIELDQRKELEDIVSTADENFLATVKQLEQLQDKQGIATKYRDVLNTKVEPDQIAKLVKDADDRVDLPRPKFESVVDDFKFNPPESYTSVLAIESHLDKKVLPKIQAQGIDVPQAMSNLRKEVQVHTNRYLALGDDFETARIKAVRAVAGRMDASPDLLNDVTKKSPLLSYHEKEYQAIYDALQPLRKWEMGLYGMEGSPIHVDRLKTPLTEKVTHIWDRGSGEAALAFTDWVPKMDRFGAVKAREDVLAPYKILKQLDTKEFGKANIADTLDYLSALNKKERIERAAEGKLKLGKVDEESLKIIDEFESANPKAAEFARTEFQKFFNSTLEYGVDTGMLNTKDVANLKGAYKNYWPQIEGDKVIIKPTSTKNNKSLGAGKGVKKAEVATTETGDPLEALLRYTDNMYNNGNRNAAYNSIMDVAIQLPDEQWNQLFGVGKDTIRKGRGIPLTKEVKELFGDTLEGTVQAAKGKDNYYVSFFRNGNNIVLPIKDKDTFDMFNYTAPANWIEDYIGEKTRKVGRGARDFVRFNITSNPIFKGAMAGIDSFIAAQRSKELQLPIANTASGAFHLATDPMLRQDIFLNLGGYGGTIAVGSTADRSIIKQLKNKRDIALDARAIKADKTIMNQATAAFDIALKEANTGMQTVNVLGAKIGTSSELAPRVKAYVEAIRRGESEADALTRLKMNTGDFFAGRGGSNKGLKGVNEGVMFLRPAIAGLDLAKLALNDPKKYVTRGAAYVTLPALAGYAMYGDKEWYKDAPVSKKLKAIPIGENDDGSGRWLEDNHGSVFAFHKFPILMVERINEEFGEGEGRKVALAMYQALTNKLKGLGEDVEFAERALPDVAQKVHSGLSEFVNKDLPPSGRSILERTMIPTDVAAVEAIKPIITGKDRFGNELNSDGRPAPIQFNENTPAYARMVSDLSANIITPRQVDAVVSATLAMNAQILDGMSDKYIRELMEYPQLPNKDLETILAKRFTTGIAQNRFKDARYVLGDKLDGLATDYNAFVVKYDNITDDSLRNKADEWIDKHENIMPIIEYYIDVRKQEGQINREYRELAYQPDSEVSLETKRKANEERHQALKELYEGFYNDMYDNKTYKDWLDENIFGL